MTLEPPPEDAQEQCNEEDRTRDDPEREHDMAGKSVPFVSELEVEGPCDSGEQVEVDQRPDHEVEDLLDHVAGQNPRERRTRHDRDEHQQRHERPQVCGDEVVEGNSCGVTRENRHVRHAARVRVTQDPVPAEGSQRRLEALEDAAEDDVTDRDLGERVPEALEPAPDVDAEKMEHDQEEHEPHDPGRNFEEAACGRLLGHRCAVHDSGFGHSPGA